MMTKELHRPCTLWGETFDAFEVCNVNSRIMLLERKVYVEVVFWGGNSIESPQVKEQSKKIRAVQRKAITTIAEALNTPILATQEVLAGLPKDAKVYTTHAKTGDVLKCTFDSEYGWLCGAGHFNEALELGKPYLIFTINDSKTLEYLLQFTLDGKRKETE